jgi:hypothetical protein
MQSTLNTQCGAEGVGGDMTESEWWGKSNIMHAQLTGHMHDASHDTYINRRYMKM